MLLLGCLLASGCAHQRPTTPAKTAAQATNLLRFEYQEPQMGVPFRMVLYSTDEATADAAAQAAFARVKQLNAIMSDYDPDSELSLLSRTSGSGNRVLVSQDLWDILLISRDLARRSDGAFDITIGPLVNLWRKARRIKQLPDAEILAETKKPVGWEKIKYYPVDRSVMLTAPNMRLDLGGIGKGYAVDAAMKILREHGIRRALVGAVGDIAVGDAPPGKPGWRVEIASLDVTNAPAKKFAILANAAISTSGDLAQRLELNGKRYSHILDPRTGLGLTDHSLVTVIARNCTITDSYDTTVSLLGPAKGLKLIRNTPGAEVRIVREPADKLEVYESPGFGRYLERQ